MATKGVEMTNARVTGGCQCGAVRYEITGPLSDPHICHCRMCQRAFGNFFAALVGVKRSDLNWNKQPPTVFHSSSIIKRGFCAKCGTPLSYANDESENLSVSIGSLDDPTLVEPKSQYGAEGRLPYIANLHTLPESRTEDDIPPAVMAKLKSWQFEP
jgi:hypothetical protein